LQINSRTAPRRRGKFKLLLVDDSSANAEASKNYKITKSLNPTSGLARGDDGFWHKADMSNWKENVRLARNSGLEAYG
jgi:hypothetical protein